LKPSKRIKEKDGYEFMYRPLWLCNKEKRIQDGICTGAACCMGACAWTMYKRYAVTKKIKVRGKWKKARWGIPLIKVKYVE
jgi:hypothetical protein